MAKEMTKEQDVLASKVQSSLQKAKKIVANLRTMNKRLLFVSIGSSAGSTLVAGVTAAGGPVVGEGVPGWRLACIVAAVFAFASTISTGVYQRMKISERLTKGKQCVGKLRALDLMITMGNREWEEVVEEYEEIVKTHPEFIS